MSPIGTIEFQGETLIFLRSAYREGNLAVLIETPEGEPYATLSVNFPRELLEDSGILTDPDAFYLKDWSENALIAQAAIDSGIIVRAAQYDSVRSGFIEASAWRLAS